MLNKIVVIIHLLSFLACAIGILIFLFRAFQMVEEFDPKRRRLANFIPILTLLRSSYTAKGKRLYDFAVKGILLALVGVIGLIGTLLVP